MSCPATIKNQRKYQLTDKQVENFCEKGCSVDCEKLFKEYGEKNLRRRKEKNEIN